MHGKELVETGAALTKRHIEYVRLIRDIHDHIIEAYTAKKELEEAKTAEEAKKTSM